MSSLENNSPARTALDVIKAVARNSPPNKPQPDDLITMVMEQVQRGTMERILYDAAGTKWYMLRDRATEVIVALIIPNHAVIYPTMEVEWVGCDAGTGNVSRITTPALAASHWPRNIVSGYQGIQEFWCHPFHLKPSNRS